MEKITPQKLVKWRTAKGYTQQQVANLVGVSQRAYSMWENGETSPKHDSVLKILEVLEVHYSTSEVTHIITEAPADYHTKRCTQCAQKEEEIKNLKKIIETQEELLQYFREERKKNKQHT